MSEIELPEPFARMTKYVADPANPYCADAVAMGSVDVFSAEQVRQLIAAERERCAKACEDLDLWDMDDPGASAAAAIRRGS